MTLGSYLVVERTAAAWSPREATDGAPGALARLEAVSDFLDGTAGSAQFAPDVAREHLVWTENRGGWLKRVGLPRDT